MHLYTFSSAPNPLRLVHLLNYKGVELETTEVNIGTGEHFEHWFKKINPASTLPTLVLDDGTILTETIEIAIYLDHLYPEKPLFGSNPLEFAQVIGWDHKIFIEGLMPVAEMFRNRGNFFKDRALPGRINVPQLDVLIERGKMRLDAFWEDFELYIKEREFIVGNQMSFADIDGYVICGFAGRIKEHVPDCCEGIHNWLSRIEALVKPVKQ